MRVKKKSKSDVQLAQISNEILDEGSPGTIKIFKGASLFTHTHKITHTHSDIHKLTCMFCSAMNWGSPSSRIFRNTFMASAKKVGYCGELTTVCNKSSERTTVCNKPYQFSQHAHPLCGWGGGGGGGGGGGTGVVIMIFFCTVKCTAQSSFPTHTWQ